jgi:ATP-GRASP peptide maturase of grasp-with-spasm system
MILLISHDSLEPSTEEVENWLHIMDADYVRINGSDIIQMCSTSIAVNTNNTSFKFILSNGIELDLSKINVVWFRRWQYYPAFDSVLSTGDLLFEKSVNDFRISEFKSLSGIFFHLIKNKRIIGSPRSLFKVPTKFEQLEAARCAGFSIPKSLITNNKKELIEFYTLADKKIITKANGEGTWLTIDQCNYGTYTSLITDNILSLLPDNFYPSLFQEFVEKEVELRVFYFNKKSYAMAIFSTLDKQTEVDFRIYNDKKPNRNTPFNLPEDIKNKIQVFMESAELLTGSLDLILNKKNEFIFLEVNPFGQFGMVSFPCNYYLEEVIAKELIGFNCNHN